MKNKFSTEQLKSKKLLIFGIVFLLIVLMSSTYAYFSYSRSFQAFTLTTNGINAVFTEGTNQISFNDAYPISDEYALSNLNKLTYVDFTVSGNTESSEESIKYEIYLTEKNGNTLDSQYVKVFLTDNTDNDITLPRIYKSLSSTSNKNDLTGKMVYSERINGVFTRNYRLYVWLDSEYSQNSVSESFSFYVNLYAYNDTTNGLYEVTFDYNDGVTASTTKQVEYGSTYGELPTPTREGYQFVGWKKINTLNSDGNQIINTLVNGNNDDLGFEIKYEWIELPNNNKMAIIFSNTLASDNAITRLSQIGPSTTRSYVNIDVYDDTSFTLTRQLDTVYLDTISKGQYTTNGETVTFDNLTNGSTTSSSNIRIFSNTNVNNNSKIRLYYLKIFENNELIRYFVPYKNLETSKFELYDIVNGNFYSNVGTGNFSYDGEFVDKYSIVESDFNHQLIAIWDNTEPTIQLSKITYKDIPFDDTWTLASGTSITNGVLNIDTSDGFATSSYLNVNGGFHYIIYDVYSETALPSSTKGGTRFDISYYDSNMASTNALTNTSHSGYANTNLPLNTWKNDHLYKSSDAWKSMNRYGENVKYIKIKFAADSTYSLPPVKYRNLKLYGEKIPNDFYDIDVTISEDIGVASIKYAKGNQVTDYFQNNGTEVVNNKVRVYENGIYTVYVKDLGGNETVNTIEITDII